MLYEVITSKNLVILFNSFDLFCYVKKDQFMLRKSLLDIMNIFVITSYSIHYTKLYEATVCIAVGFYAKTEP